MREAWRVAAGGGGGHGRDCVPDRALGVRGICDSFTQLEERLSDLTTLLSALKTPGDGKQ